MNDFIANALRPQPITLSILDSREGSSTVRQDPTANGNTGIEGSGGTRSNEEVIDNNATSLVSQTVRQLRDVTQNLRRDLSFDIDEESGRVIIQVYDSETQELIRTIPPEEIRAMVSDIEELAGSVKKGLFVKVTV